MEKRTKFSIFYYIFVVFFLFILQIYFLGEHRKEIAYSEFKQLVEQGKIKEVQISDEKILGVFADTKKPFKVVRVKGDEQLVPFLEQHQVTYKGIVESHWLRSLFLGWLLPFFILFLLWGGIYRRMGANVMSFGKSRAKIYAQEGSKVTFKDVAGVDEVVEELKEIVEFLKDPAKFQKLGARLPKGVLLVGPPGTGKTLLAKAVAGEANVPFFSISGSEFVEMFVGVGAARVRDLFQQAKQKAPCIVFIDEIDAIGRSRGRGVIMGGHDEREQTLNQLLVEMDGFQSEKGVIIMAATNRPDVLDPALLRPGRFDRQILVDKPDLKGRVEIFKIHTRNMPVDKDVDFKVLAAQTPGFAGAEIANVANEAALLASRRGKKKVGMAEFQEAIERVIAGLEKKNKVINEREKQVIAYHEAGHAVVGHFLPHTDPVQKISIVPRGLGALGYTIQTPLEDRYLLTKGELMDRVTGLLGGRAAEEIAFGEISTGAQNDLERATEIARSMVIQYGMSEKLGPLTFCEDQDHRFLGQELLLRRCSENTARLIDEEIQEIVRQAYDRAKNLLIEKRPLLEELARKLLEKETLGRKEIEEVLGPKPMVPELAVTN